MRADIEERPGHCVVGASTCLFQTCRVRESVPMSSPKEARMVPDLGQVRAEALDALTFPLSPGAPSPSRFASAVRRRFIVRVLRHELATYGEVEDGLAEVLDLVGARGESLECV